ncbi:MAG TPA: TolC family protein [Acetivibrio sp.]|nr:TolC family protein [Acetivibrio sp.]HPT91055.1 TolC family protein [Acetivibrio sp.]HQA58218.1 TolC family protein [Acetivibrio sp.]
MKKIVSMLVAAVTLTFVLQSYATKESSLSYDSGKEIMLKSSRTISKQKLAERKAFYQYGTTVQRTKGINTQYTSFDTPFGKYTIVYTPDIQVLLTKQTELLPLQMKYYWNMTDNGRKVTEMALSLGFRDMYLGFLKADRDYKMSLKKLELQKRKLEASKVKLEQGIITSIEFEEEEYNYLKAQKSVEAGKRNRENMQRTVNSYIGSPIDTNYDTLLYSEYTRNLKLESLDYYVENALKERLEITSLIEEIELKEKHLQILSKAQAKDIYTELRKEYDDASLELETLKVKLEQAKYDVENNIKSAYIDVKREGHNLRNMQETLNMQKRSYERLKNQYEQGFIPKLVIDEMALGIEELQNTLELVIYSYNTKIMKLEEAAGLGPAY